ncbi:FRG domain-containing protein [Novosphingobium sp. 2637]|uniref:FRG domain-containing protein n=2 Tax=Novosphingobium mangrovi (ex Hu et al. 2023) TaxID=2930094 RepID=A0ABT0ACY4_9SPHN|nr:FRG domain-containing protein [Novosphingobium mangrovi (ex Hu et al. 2023)]
MGMNGWGVVQQYMDALRQHGRNGSLYRGQPNKNWKIVPSVFRDGQRGIRDLDGLSLWKREAARFASPLPQDDVGWLILAQHYGIPTPLLDWSTSPLVGLFFACDGPEHRNEDGCVYRSRINNFKIIDYPRTISLFKTPDNEGFLYTEKPLLINAVGHNARSTAQDSFLSLHYDADTSKTEPIVIFEVQASLKRDTLLTLEKLGHTAERLYSDITRFADSFKGRLCGGVLPGWD